MLSFPHLQTSSHQKVTYIPLASIKIQGTEIPAAETTEFLLTLVARNCQLREVHTGLEASKPR